MTDMPATKARVEASQRQMNNTLVSLLVAICLAAAIGGLGYSFALLY